MNFSEQKIQKALEDSLLRLQTDYVDLYQLHWPKEKLKISRQKIDGKYFLRNGEIVG